MRVKRLIRAYWPYALIVAAIAVAYRGWLSSGTMVYADWSYGADVRLNDFLPIPSIWDSPSGTGGANILAGPYLPLVALQAFLFQFGISHELSTRIVWIFVGLLAGSFATYKLAMTLYANRVAAIIGALFVVFSYYVMRIMSGGQLTVGNGALFIPLVFWLFYRALQRPTLSRLAPTGLAVGIQIMYDLRSTYLTLGVLLLFTFFYLLAQQGRAALKRAALRLSLQFAVMAVVAVCMHLFWLLPGRFAETIALPKGYNSVGWVGFLSYFHFENGFTLYKPPQGTYIPPYLFLLPILAFGVLLWRRITYIDLFLAALALLAVFFIKGGNDPAGGIYNWMFTHFPGFSMYRDPSKFHQPLVLAYALMLGRIVTALTSRGEGRVPRARVRWSPWMLARIAVPLVCLIPVLDTVAPVAAGDQYGTLTPITVPSEYIALQHFMNRQTQFFRTMWVYGETEYIGNSDIHPAMTTNDVNQQLQTNGQSSSASNASAWLLLPRARAILQSLSVKYLVVGDNANPGDTPDMTAQNKVGEAQSLRLVRKAFPHFAETRIGKIYLFRNPSYAPAIYVAGPLTHARAQALMRRADAPINAGVRRTGAYGEYHSACNGCFDIASTGRTRYEIVVRHATRPFLLVLSQSFDPNWDVYIEPSTAPQPFWWTWTHRAEPHRYHTTVNEFANAWLIDRPGTYRIVVEYWPQRLTDIGYILCVLTALICAAIAVGPVVMSWAHRRAGHREGDALAVRPDIAAASSNVRPERTVGRQTAR